MWMFCVHFSTVIVVLLHHRQALLIYSLYYYVYYYDIVHLIMEAAIASECLYLWLFFYLHVSTFCSQVKWSKKRTDIRYNITSKAIAKSNVWIKCEMLRTLK